MRRERERGGGVGVERKKNTTPEGGRNAEVAPLPKKFTCSIFFFLLLRFASLRQARSLSLVRRNLAPSQSYDYGKLQALDGRLVPRSSPREASFFFFGERQQQLRIALARFCCRPSRAAPQAPLVQLRR